MTIKQLETVAKSLPAYFGSKRSLIEDIVSCFPITTNPAEVTIVDPMGGSMTIPLIAKHLGYSVIVNDRMAGPNCLATGIVQNNDVLIDVNKLQQLITKPTTATSTYISKMYGDVHLPIALANIADNIYNNIQLMDARQRPVYTALLYRFLTFMAPYQQYRYKKLVQQFNNGSHHASMTHHIERWREHIQDPLPTLSKLAQQINAAICHGTVEVHQKDVFDFLDEKPAGNVLYLDPPYAGASVTYEAGYGVIDNMITGKTNVTPTSVFNNKKIERDVLKRLCEYSVNYDITVFSYWSKLHDTAWFEDIFAELNLNFLQLDIDHSYRYSTKKDVNNDQAGQRTTWSGAQRKTAGKTEILYALTPK